MKWRFWEKEPEIRVYKIESLVSIDAVAMKKAQEEYDEMTEGQQRIVDEYWRRLTNQVIYGNEEGPEDVGA